MANKPADSRRKIEKGRQDVADTSSAIAEKLAILEHRVQETIDACLGDNIIDLSGRWQQNLFAQGPQRTCDRCQGCPFEVGKVVLNLTGALTRNTLRGLSARGRRISCRA